jgi:indolepyruvate ferredoxin oxidoreductase
VTGLDATALALGLTGDTIAANLMVVGMAAQMGALPVTAEALERAITLNGVAIALNLKAFRLGRLFVVDPDKVRRLAHTAPEPPATPQTLADTVAHRSAHLAAYQNEALAQRYRDRVAAVYAAEQATAPDSELLALVFARNYARLLAIKDEYEVARLLTDPALRAKIAAGFDGGARLGFNLAPPFLPGRAADGRPLKREFPAWFALPALRAIASLRGLRGTPFDVFGWTAERRAERDLCADYEALAERTLKTLTADNLAQAAAVLNEIASVRGYGPVKDAAMRAYAQTIRAAEAKSAERATARLSLVTTP